MRCWRSFLVMISAKYDGINQATIVANFLYSYNHWKIKINSSMDILTNRKIVQLEKIQDKMLLKKLEN